MVRARRSYRTKRRKFPMRAVVSSDYQNGGNSIFPSKLPLGGEWELKLECGHVVMRPAYYNPPEPDEHPKHGWYRRRRSSAVKPAPRRVHCSKCDEIK